MFKVADLVSWNLVDSYSYSRTVLAAKSDSDVMFCLQNYQGLVINRSLVY